METMDTYFPFKGLLVTVIVKITDSAFGFNVCRMRSYKQIISHPILLLNSFDPRCKDDVAVISLLTVTAVHV